MSRTSFAISMVASAFLLAACAESPTSALDVPLSMAKPPGSGGGPNSSTPVVSDLGSHENGLSVRSDNGTAYANGSGVVSVLQSVGDWELDLTGSTTRTMRINLNEMVPGMTTGGPTGDLNVKARIISKATAVGTTYPAITTDRSDIPLVIGEFVVAGKTYRVAMNPQNNPETNAVNVTCTSATNPCTSWRVTPTGADSRNIAVLFEVGKKGDVKVGYRYLSFDFTLSR